jgi:hypothetical protein
MAAFLNRVGMRYGRLLVKSHAGRDRRKKHIWLCVCDCGNEKVVVGDNLSSKKSKSCGCLKAEFLAAKGNQFGLLEDRYDAIMRVQYSHLKRRDTKMKFKIRGDILSYEAFLRKSSFPCFYCGLEHSKEIEDRTNETKGTKMLSVQVAKINGLDRVDPRLNYTAENTVPCCKFCNFAKHTMSQDDFYRWVSRVYHYTAKKFCPA